VGVESVLVGFCVGKLTKSMWERGRRKKKIDDRHLPSLLLSRSHPFRCGGWGVVGLGSAARQRITHLCLTYANILAGAGEPALNWNGALAFGVDCKKNIFGLFSLVSLFCFQVIFS